MQALTSKAISIILCNISLVTLEEDIKIQVVTLGSFNPGGRRNWNSGNSNKPDCQVCGKHGDIVLDCWHSFEQDFQPSQPLCNNSQSSMSAMMAAACIAFDSNWYPDSVLQIILPLMPITWQPHWIMLAMSKYTLEMEQVWTYITLVHPPSNLNSIPEFFPQKTSYMSLLSLRIT